MDLREIESYKKVQSIAKETMRYLRNVIKYGATEEDIAKIAEGHMLAGGAQSFWYHNVGALVLVGERTALSVSGKSYVPDPGNVVRPIDLVTVDLSPQIGTYWGDFARSFVVSPERNSNAAKSIAMGKKTLVRTHEFFRKVARPDMTFDEIHRIMNGYIESQGFVNLDYRKNLGHTIERDIDARIYMEKGNNRQLGDVGLFTFEPHIRHDEGVFGHKREDIYYFQNGMLRVL